MRRLRDPLVLSTVNYSTEVLLRHDWAALAFLGHCDTEN